MAAAVPAAAALAAEHQQQQQQPLQHPRLGSLQRISPPKTSSNESFTHQQVSSNRMLQQAATSSGVSGDAAAGAGLGLQANACLRAAQQQQQQQQVLLQQSLWRANGQQQQQQQVPAGSQEAGLAGVDAAAAALLDGSTEDAAILQELLDELCPAGQPAAAAAGKTTGQHLAVAGACTAPAGAAGPFGSSSDPLVTAAAAGSIVHQLAPQQQQQQQQQQQVGVTQQQQQQVAGLDGMTWRQGSNSSSTSNVTNNSSASPPDMQTTSAAAAAVCQAGVPTYSYAAYQAASQMQPGYHQLSLPVTDGLLQSIAADLGLPMQQSSSQQQQLLQLQVTPLAHSASVTQPMLQQQQLPVMQTMGWQAPASTAAAGLAMPGLAGSSAAYCAAVPSAASNMLAAQQQYAYMAQQQVSASAGLQQGLLQLPHQQLQRAGMHSRMNSMQATTAAPTNSAELAGASGSQSAGKHLTGVQAAAAAPATSAEAASAAAAAAGAGGNPLAGQLTGAQRAAAASHIRSMLMVAAAAGESSKAVMARALQLMQQCGDWVPHTALLQLNSLSVKLMGAQPCDLPEDVREQLIAAVVGATMPEAFLRPGCSLITLDYTSCRSSSSSSSSGARSEVGRAQDAATVLQRLCGPSGSWFAQQDVRVQLAATFAEWLPAQQQQQQQQGEVESTDSSSSCTAVAAAAPLVVLASSPALHQQDWQGAWLAVNCHGLAGGEQLQLTARSAGQYYEIDEESIAVEPCAALSSSSAADVRSGSRSSWGSWLGSRLSRHAGARPAAAAAAASGGGAQGLGQSVLVWFRLAEQPRQGPLRIEVTCSSSGACGSVVSAAAVQQVACALLQYSYASCCA
jgi:hypothetical protein